MQAHKIHPPDFAIALREDIAANRIRLPTLPEVALRVKEAVEGEASARGIAELVGQDIALSGRIVQVANSARYRGAEQVESIQVAVTRLGTRLVRSLVVGLALRQMFKSPSAALSRCFREVWATGVEVAAISRALAAIQPGLDPEEAMLGGLLHNIGALPILARLNEAPEAVPGGSPVQQLIDELAPEIGMQILRSWEFPSALIAVPQGCQALDYDSGPGIDYVDVVLAARLQHLFTEGLIDITPEMNALPALEKLGIHFEAVELQPAGSSAWAAQVRSALDS